MLIEQGPGAGTEAVADWSRMYVQVHSARVYESVVRVRVRFDGLADREKAKERSESERGN